MFDRLGSSGEEGREGGKCVTFELLSKVVVQNHMHCPARGVAVWSPKTLPIFSVKVPRAAFEIVTPPGHHKHAQSFVSLVSNVCASSCFPYYFDIAFCERRSDPFYV